MLMEKPNSLEHDNKAQELANKLMDIMDQSELTVLEKAVRYMGVGQRDKLLRSIQMAKRNAGGSLTQAQDITI
jgi:hypothetical protein